MGLAVAMSGHLAYGEHCLGIELNESFNAGELAA
jgi:hypothetical protein